MERFWKSLCKIQLFFTFTIDVESYFNEALYKFHDIVVTRPNILQICIKFLFQYLLYGLQVFGGCFETVHFSDIPKGQNREEWVPGISGVRESLKSNDLIKKVLQHKHSFLGSVDHCIILVKSTLSFIDIKQSIERNKS